MNSYDRVMTAMKLGQPDRVPVVEYVVDPKMISAVLFPWQQSFFENKGSFSCRLEILHAIKKLVNYALHPCG